MAWFGRLLYLIERHNSRQPRPFAQARPKMGRPRGSRGGGGGGEREGGEGDAEGEGEGGEEEAGEVEEEQAEDEGEAGGGGGGGVRRGSAAVAAARQRLQADMAARRAALASADPRAEPGLRFWLARQQRRWRQQVLPAELGLMLQLAGVQLDPYSPLEWQALAHAAAALLQGSQVPLDPRTRQQLAAQQRRRAADAAAPLAGEQTSGGGGGGGDEGGGAGRAAAASFERQGPPPQPQPRQPPLGSPRLRVARWVQTQQALFADGMLSTAQLRYMAFLGGFMAGPGEGLETGRGGRERWACRTRAPGRHAARLDLGSCSGTVQALAAAAAVAMLALPQRGSSVPGLKAAA
jgi:hypothetical protein